MDAQLALESQDDLTLQVTPSEDATLSLHLAPTLGGLLMSLLGYAIYQFL